MGKSSERAISTIQGIVLVLAISIVMVSSLTLAKVASPPTRGPNDGNSARFAVIDLGTNAFYPQKITDSGYILSCDSWNGADGYGYVWHNGIWITLDPPGGENSQVTDIDEGGLAVGVEYGDTSFFIGPPDVAFVAQVTTWDTSGITATTSLAATVLPHEVGTSSNGPWVYGGNIAGAYGSISLVSGGTIWSVQLVDEKQLWGSNTDAFIVDGFKNGAEMGAVAFNSDPTAPAGSVTGYALFPIAVNNSQQCLENQVNYGDTPTNNFSVNGLPVPTTFQSYYSPRPLSNTNGLGDTYLLGSVGTNSAYWDVGSSSPMNFPFYYAVVAMNAATTNMPAVGGVPGPTVAASQVLTIVGQLAEMIPTTSSTKTFGPLQDLSTLIPTNSGWSGVYGNNLNDYGAIVGTATSSGSAPTTTVGGSSFADSTLAPADTFPVPASGSHGVLLVPLQLKLLNGSTPDFDGTVITSIIPAPENPNYTNDTNTEGGTGLGPQTMGQGRAESPGDVYTAPIMVAAQAPASMSGIQYQWKRYLVRRSWYIQKVTTGGVVSYNVTQRSSRGTTTPADDTDDGTWSNTNPSSVKHEFYEFDDSALGYGGFANDTNGYMPAGSYILEKKAFTYQVNLSFDGTNWTPGPSLPVAQVITVKYQSTTGTTASTNWVGVPNLQAGNTNSVGNLTPTITPTDVQNITSSTNFTIAPTANN